jgi:hypothetical protein
MNRLSKSFLEQFDQLNQLWDDNENLRALARIIMIIIFLILIVWIGSLILPFLEADVDRAFLEALPQVPTIAAEPTQVVQQTEQSLSEEPTEEEPITTIQPPDALIERLRTLIMSINWRYIRFIILPISAFLVVIIAGAYFVNDIYALPQLRHGLKYVISSIFGIMYPYLVIAKGKKQLKEGQLNTLDKIGGPGFVIVKPGNAVIFKNLNGPLKKVGITRPEFLKRFEKIGPIANLDEQHNHEAEFGPITTKDGIKVKLQDINYRFRIISDPRTLENPYPIKENALKRMAGNRSVGPHGMPTWRENVHTLVKSALTAYINSHTIDFLTAPRTDKQDPRNNMRQTMLSEASTRSLSGIGAELLWIDVGHIDIVGTEVDEERVNLWAADWVGNAEAARAYGEAKRQAYREIGRAEAQAEMIIGITRAFEEMDINNDPKENIRNMLLSRTSQILDLMSRKNKETDSKEEEVNDKNK